MELTPCRGAAPGRAQPGRTVLARPSARRTVSISQPSKLLDLPLEIQRMIFDRYYEPWSLRIVDNYWRIKDSKHFNLDAYARKSDYETCALVGTPCVSLSLTCRHIHRETRSSMLKAYRGVLGVDLRSCHLKLPTFPSWLSDIYKLTRILHIEERAFVDLFSPKNFPNLRELTISCFPIFSPDTRSGRTAPLDDEGYQLWARRYSKILERRSRKKLLNARYVTVLDSQAEQYESSESVFCYLAEVMGDIQVVRESLV